MFMRVHAFLVVMASRHALSARAQKDLQSNIALVAVETLYGFSYLKRPVTPLFFFSKNKYVYKLLAELDFFKLPYKGLIIALELKLYMP